MAAKTMTMTMTMSMATSAALRGNDLVRLRPSEFSLGRKTHTPDSCATARLSRCFFRRRSLRSLSDGSASSSVPPNVCILREPRVVGVGSSLTKQKKSDGLARRGGRNCRCQSAMAEDVQVLDDASPSAETAVLPFRIGHGFDLHRLEPGFPLIIGGVNIPHDRGCDAHSDGDVLLHCLVDAILGALSLPDIGQLFPDNDPKWKGADSSVFMKEAVRRMHAAGYDIGNVDATIILQRPKLSPHKPVILQNLCELLGVSQSVLNLKAKTHEKVDSLGENRSVACHAVVLLARKIA